VRFDLSGCVVERVSDEHRAAAIAKTAELTQRTQAKARIESNQGRDRIRARSDGSAA